MPTLKEIKGRIASVKNTLKITSAMKLVSSAKLRKAQNAIEALRPYEEQLRRILSALPAAGAAPAGTDSGILVPGDGKTGSSAAPRAIVAIASNSSLCGGFNANAIAKVRSVRRTGDVVYSIGRKMADAMRADGFPSPEDFSALSEHPAYAPAAALANRLAQDFADGRVSSVLLVYNHFVSTARQTPVTDPLLPVTATPVAPGTSSPVIPSASSPVIPSAVEGSPAPSDYILEPSARELLAVLLPKTLKLKLYAALLDSAAAEHAARTVAMQTATDNGNNLLEELTLQYNKGRQQKITNEILDLAGGQQE